MSSSTQRACVLEDVVAVTGGGITDDEAAWMIKPTIVEGKRFAEIYIDNYRCRQFLGKGFSMVKHIKTIRDKEVSARMRALSQEEDPNEERVQTDSTTCKPKRGLIDRIPKILTIEVR